MPLAPAVEPIRASERSSPHTRLLAYYPWLLVLLLTAVAALLRFHFLGQKSVWIDEGVTIEMARLGWYNFLRILWRHEANMAFYTVLLRFWLPFGDSEAWIRTLSVVAALAT
ncbi:MAG: hypothetical protein JO249_17580, partial [Acidobacteria bacterium]|nr:hypothetical protein [Acidobacteriota bacterium]